MSGKALAGFTPTGLKVPRARGLTFQEHCNMCKKNRYEEESENVDMEI